VFLTAQVPLLTLIVTVAFFWSLRRGAERLPFLMALALFLMGFVGLGVSMYPYLVPRAITLWDAAAPPSSQSFMLVGTAVIFPIIIALHGVGLLGISRQGGHAWIPLTLRQASRERLPRCRCGSGLGWLVVIWSASVAAMFVVSGLLRLWLKILRA
jgi:hypothetical protein